MYVQGATQEDVLAFVSYMSVVLTISLAGFHGSLQLVPPLCLLDKTPISASMPTIPVPALICTYLKAHSIL